MANGENNGPFYTTNPMTYIHDFNTGDYDINNPFYFTYLTI